MGSNKQNPQRWTNNYSYDLDKALTVARALGGFLNLYSQDTPFYGGLDMETNCLLQDYG